MSGLTATGADNEPTKIVVEGSSTVGPISEALAEYYMKNHPEVKITVGGSGSGNGAKALIRGACDVADMSRFMKDSEFKAAVDANVFPVAHVIALDGIAVVVHPSNPVSGLTIEQVRDIFHGKIRNWKELGGPDLEIVKISRDQNSGTYECFESLVMAGAEVDAAAEKQGTNGAVRGRVQSTPAAIGYVGVGYVDKTLKVLSVNGVAPSRATIVSGAYPIARPLFMFTNGYPRLGSHVQAFVSLHLSPEGQRLIEEAGFIPVTSYASDESH